jgi:hypothetical protein
MKGKILLALVAVALLLAITVLHLPKQIHSSGGVLVRMGYDEQGKYILVAPREPALIEELKVGRKVVARNIWAPVEGARVPYNWKPKRVYAVDVRLSTGREVVRVAAPPLSPVLDAEPLAYNSSDRAELLLRMLYAEYDRIIILRTSHLPERVHILSMPAVGISQGDLDSFTSALSDLLRKAHVEVDFGSRVSEKELQDRRTVLVVAGGVMPSDEKLLDAVRSQRRWGECRIIYLGLQPGAVLVDQSGNTMPGRILPGTLSGSAEVRSKVLKMKKSLYTSSTFSAAPAHREDGSPAVYLTGCTLVFSNTISGGWDSPEDAAWDVFYAVLTDGSMNPPEVQLTPDRDAGSALLRLTYSEQNISLLAFRGDKLSSVLHLKAPVVGEPLEADLTLLEDPMPGEVEAVVWVSNASGRVRVIATSLSTNQTLVTDLGRAEGEASFRAKLHLPPGDVLLGVESGGHLSAVKEFHVPVIRAAARPVKGGYLVNVTEDGSPYSGEVVVSSPRGGTGRLKIQGRLFVRDSSFNLVLRGYQVPVTYFPPEKRNVPVGLIAAALAALLLTVMSRLRPRRRQPTVRIRIHVPEPEEEQVRASSIISAMERYNKQRGVAYLPLSLEEVREAISTFAARTAPSPASALALLEKMKLLEGDAQIKEVHGYYAPAAWERAADQSVEHLAMIRAVYDWATSRGFIAEPFTTRGDTFEGAPDMLLLSPDDRVVYVEVVSGRRKAHLERLLKTYTRWAENLASTEAESYSLPASIWVVLTEDIYTLYREKLESWDFAMKLKALEKEGYLRVVSIADFLRDSER